MSNQAWVPAFECWAKKDDDNVILSFTLSDATGPVDLTGVTAAFIFRNEASVSVTTVTGAADGDQLANRGKVTVTLTDTHLATAGVCKAEWQITDTGYVRTYPSGPRAWGRFTIDDDL